MDLKIIKDNIGNYQIKYFKEVNSTHNFIKENWKTISNKTIVIADNQTEGIGTHGRVWYTGKDNIAMTLVYKPKCKISEIENITIKIANSIKSAIFSLYKIDLKVKEPNDLMLDNKKICGILTEINTLKENVNYLLISIGFNVNEEKFDNELELIATSLKKELKKEFDITDICIKIIQNIHEQIIVNLTSQNNRKDVY